VVVDALCSGDKPFILKKIRPAGNFTFTTHSLSPEAVAFLSEALYGKKPEILTLAIRGYEFAVGEGLSPGAGKNLEAALNFFMKKFGTRQARPRTSAIIKESEKRHLKRSQHGKKQKRSPGS